jgi:23S rRNA pseudouridine2605 synthase
LTSEQLEAARSERMRQNGNGALTLEEARTWMEETGLCLFLPRRQFSSSLAPSFVEAVAGQRNTTPEPKHIALAEELLVRLETDGVAVRLNLLGQPGEQPDYVVAAWVLPYVYALRGDRDWRRSPQLTGSRQVSPLAIQAYKRLEAGDTTISDLKQVLGREVSEAAVLRGITELWQQLRIIPIVSAPGQAAQWQLLRHRFQKAIAEGASTSQVTAISVLASIYLQAVIAASMEEVEIFLSPLTARSKIREVLRGLVATRQVHTLSLGHAPHFYVAGTLPEFAIAPTAYASSSMSSSYFSRFHDLEESSPEPAAVETVAAAVVAEAQIKSQEPQAEPAPAIRKPAVNGKAAAPRAHFSRPAAHSRDRKPAQPSGSARPARRSADSRSAGPRSTAGSRTAAGGRWTAGGSKSANGARTDNGSSAGMAASNGARSNGNGLASRPTSGTRSAKPTGQTWTKRNGNGSAVAGKPAASGRSGSMTRSAAAPRKDSRTDARAGHASRKPALTAGAKAGNSKRFGFTARPNQGTKKRG